MEIAFSVAFWAGLAVLAIAVLACFMPLRLEITSTKETLWTFQAALRPFGLFGPRIPIAYKPSKRKGPQATTKRGRNLPAPKLLRAGLRFLRDILALIRLERFHCRCRFGCADPSDTGQIFGALAPAIYGTGHTPDFRLEVRPDFSAEILEGEVELALSLVPARLLLPSASFAWHAFGPV